MTKFRITNSKNMCLLLPPILICIFPYFKIAYFPSAKSEKSKKLNFFVPIVCTPKIVLWDNSLMLCCSPKNFSWFFETFLVLKILAKKHFCRKKRLDHRNFKKTKSKKLQIFARSGGIWVQYLGGGSFLGIRGNFCKKNYMIWVLNAFCVHQKFVSIILT